MLPGSQNAAAVRSRDKIPSHDILIEPLFLYALLFLHAIIAMFTPQKPRQRPGAAHTPSKTVPLKGFFDDGVWHCNCDPRIPASNFQVKKQGPNNGRWFYTCQKQRDDGGCGFFLWKDDAVGREKRAVMGNSRSEVERPVTPTPRSANGRIPARYSPEAGSGADQEDYSDWSLSPEDERDLARRLGRDNPISYPPETPRKMIKTNDMTTPGSKRKLDEHVLPTPSTGGKILGRSGPGHHDEDIFTTPTSRLKEGKWEGNERFGLRSPSGTPTPTRFREGTAFTETQGDSQGVRPPPSYDISDEMLELLKDSYIDGDTMARLKALLSKHAMRVSGIAKGRDITRVALKAKDSKIAELQQKISSLEAQREMDRTVIRHLKSDMSEGVERSRGESRGTGS
ncbi:uncharacterized protein L3040_004701 [Drepanopeziza brunnea f. sp. 'multigermtubi']|nr:hypothetical protein L3040_004701 [Drepanopeziza brunnea f. sp. 'multigermtubi']